MLDTSIGAVLRSALAKLIPPLAQLPFPEAVFFWVLFGWYRRRQVVEGV